MPGEVSRQFNPMPDEDPPEDAIIQDAELKADYPADVLKGEIRRLRGLLDDCWLSAGLLAPDVTGQPWQAWDTGCELANEIDDMRWEIDELRAGVEEDDEPTT